MILKTIELFLSLANDDDGGSVPIKEFIKEDYYERYLKREYKPILKLMLEDLSTGKDICKRLNISYKKLNKMKEEILTDLEDFGYGESNIPYSSCYFTVTGEGYWRGDSSKKIVSMKLPCS